jgi:nucleoside-triphosphatase
MGRAVLLTGHPGSGKTTAIQKVVAKLSWEAGGFYTQEIRESGRRLGFKIITLDGKEAVLAHVDVPGQPRVSKYGVDINALDRIGVESIGEAVEGKSLVVVDEIGPMEMLSDRFRQAVLEALESDVPLLGSVVQRSTPFTDTIKARPDVQVVELRRDNRNIIVGRLVKMIKGS